MKPPSERPPSGEGAGNAPALSVRNLGFEYPPRRGRGKARSALRDVSFEVPAGHFHCILGPNGSGKSTLFRILTTSLIPPEGRVFVFGSDLASDRLRAIRSRLGVVFQAPALDRKLTVSENLACHGALHGLPRAEIARRSGELLERLSLADRAGDAVEILSGGLQRRVELAKALLHGPDLLLMDEPTTGLDPTARMEFLDLLRRCRTDAGTTILYTTHILEEAEECDGLLILDDGRVVARGAPATLRAGVGRELIALRSRDAAALLESLSARYRHASWRVEDTVRLECDDASSLLPELLRTYGESVDMVQVSRPTIGDVYVKMTGRRFRADGEGAG